MATVCSYLIISYYNILYFILLLILHFCFRCWPKEPYPINFGEKLLLRLAAFKLGLINTASLPKRALQFGSRIAIKKENANDISDRL